METRKMRGKRCDEGRRFEDEGMKGSNRERCEEKGKQVKGR